MLLIPPPLDCTMKSLVMYLSNLMLFRITRFVGMNHNRLELACLDQETPYHKVVSLDHVKIVLPYPVLLGH